MWHDIGFLVGGMLLGFLGNMLISAFTVYRKLDQLLLTMVTTAQLSEVVAALRKEIETSRHLIRNEVGILVMRAAEDAEKRSDQLDTRVRDLERRPT